MYGSRHCHYNRVLQRRANRLRHSMTKAEACLWKYVLRDRKMMGYQFRRQRSVLVYIADFMCKELKLIIECDGITHQSDEAICRDRERQRKLEDYGYHVLRFTDAEVLHNIGGAHETIEKVIRAIVTRTGSQAASP